MNEWTCKRDGGHRIIAVPDAEGHIGEWVQLEHATSEQLRAARESTFWPGRGGIGWACSGAGCHRDGRVREGR